MKESYEEELATHFGLQRRAGNGNVSGLSVRAEGSAGRAIELRNACRPCPDWSCMKKKAKLASRNAAAAAKDVKQEA